VIAGETPASIAHRYRTAVDRLLKLNGLEPTVVLQPGQLLAIPQ
jgi:LysM repeat protein